MEALLVLFYFVLFSFGIYRLSFFEVESISRKWMIAFFALKVLAGICLGLVYTYYYTDRSNADIFKYFDDSKVMSDALFSAPGDFFKMLAGIGNDTPYFNEHYYEKMNSWIRPYETSIYNDSHTIIRFNAIVRFFSFGFYQVHTVFMCFVSFLGLTALLKAYNLSGYRSRFIAGALFLIPSVVFWGSGVLKEGLLFFVLGVFLLQLVQIGKLGFSYLRVILILACGSILLILKIYILAALLPCLIAYIWVEVRPKFGLVKYLLVFLCFAIIAFGLPYVFPEYNILEVLANKQNDFIRHAQVVESGSLISSKALEPNMASFLKMVPEALYNTLFKPLPWEAKSLFMLVSGIENLILIILALFALALKRKVKDMPINLLLFHLFLVVAVFCFIGWTTPVGGAIVRYKVSVLPFMVTTFLFIIDQEKLKGLLKFLRSF